MKEHKSSYLQKIREALHLDLEEWLCEERSSFRLDCQNFLRCDGKVADAQAGRVIDSIGDGGRHAGRTKFTDALGAERTRVGVEFIDESDIDLRRNVSVDRKGNAR